MERTTVLITGCSSGIGLGLAARLAADGGFKVYATMRDLAKGERLLQRLGGRCPGTLELLQLDVTDPRSLEAAARRVQGQALDVLVCNAGVGLMGPLETCSDQDMKNVFDVNLFGAIRTIQAFLPAMKRRRAGRIIVSSSIGGLQVSAAGLRPCRQAPRWGGRVRLMAQLPPQPDAGGVRAGEHELPGQPAAPGPRRQRTAGPGRRDARSLPPVPAALPGALPRRGAGGGGGRAGVPGGHGQPLSPAALRHHPAPGAARPAPPARRLRVRPGHARLRVRPRRGRRGPALTGRGGRAPPGHK
ncbi:17-beta-hydroxysteroid dehydrogenase type 1 isoform X1 [Lathamus discolor]|uniref:17-beta-hydroxysteroid dehydrogenase type 1 isoform X1 n=1 Tax=Lathamus discolor TaxID=678569 RepID=UPI0032B878BD